MNVDLSKFEAVSKYKGAIKIGDYMQIKDSLLRVIAVGSRQGSGPRPHQFWIAHSDGVVRDYSSPWDDRSNITVFVPKESATPVGAFKDMLSETLGILKHQLKDEMEFSFWKPIQMEIYALEYDLNGDPIPNYTEEEWQEVYQTYRRGFHE